MGEQPQHLLDAIGLFDGYLPENTTLTIEETNCRITAKYIFRLHYTSPKSNRTMCMTAKGDTLPTDHDYLFSFYLRQLVLTPKELARELSYLYFLERRAKQDEFLFGSKNVRVKGATLLEGGEDGAVSADDMSFEGYIGAEV